MRKRLSVSLACVLLAGGLVGCGTAASPPTPPPIGQPDPVSPPPTSPQPAGSIRITVDPALGATQIEAPFGGVNASAGAVKMMVPDGMYAPVMAKDAQGLVVGLGLAWNDKDPVRIDRESTALTLLAHSTLLNISSPQIRKRVVELLPQQPTFAAFVQGLDPREPRLSEAGGDALAAAFAAAVAELKQAPAQAGTLSAQDVQDTVKVDKRFWTLLEINTTPGDATGVIIKNRFPYKVRTTLSSVSDPKTPISISGGDKPYLDFDGPLSISGVGVFDFAAGQLIPPTQRFNLPECGRYTLDASLIGLPPAFDFKNVTVDSVAAYGNDVLDSPFTANMAPILSTVLSNFGLSWAVDTLRPNVRATGHAMLVFGSVMDTVLAARDSGMPEDSAGVLDMLTYIVNSKELAKNMGELLAILLKEYDLAGVIGDFDSNFMTARLERFNQPFKLTIDKFQGGSALAKSVTKKSLTGPLAAFDYAVGATFLLEVARYLKSHDDVLDTAVFTAGSNVSGLAVSALRDTEAEGGPLSAPTRGFISSALGVGPDGKTRFRDMYTTFVHFGCTATVVTWKGDMVKLAEPPVGNGGELPGDAFLLLDDPDNTTPGRFTVPGTVNGRPGRRTVKVRAICSGQVAEQNIDIRLFDDGKPVDRPLSHTFECKPNQYVYFQTGTPVAGPGPDMYSIVAVYDGVADTSKTLSLLESKYYNADECARQRSGPRDFMFNEWLNKHPVEAVHTLRQRWQEKTGRELMFDYAKGGSSCEAPERLWYTYGRMGAEAMVFAGLMRFEDVPFSKAHPMYQQPPQTWFYGP